VLAKDYESAQPQSVLQAHDVQPCLKVMHPAGCFHQMVGFFGPSIFTLWKFALLQKRILLFSQPPIGVVCYRVYAIYQLACQPIPFLTNTPSPPLFNVTLHDIDNLRAYTSFVACTSDRIFESKRRLYDVFVDNQNIEYCAPEFPTALMRPNSEDVSRHRVLTESLRHEHDVARYFVELNMRIFGKLLDLATGPDQRVTREVMCELGLHPYEDIHFVRLLCETYDIRLSMDFAESLLPCATASCC